MEITPGLPRQARASIVLLAPLQGALLHLAQHGATPGGGRSRRRAAGCAGTLWC